MIHSHAIVDDESQISDDPNVWAFAHVMKNAQIGRCCNIGDHAFVESGAIVGNNVTLKNNVLIWEGITIEDDVFVGPGVIFTNDRYPRSGRMEAAKQRYSDKANWLARTIVRRGSSIGAGSILCPGVELGRSSMVAAGALVTKNVDPHSLVIGSPARHVHYVCSCGQKLDGHFSEATCDACGETGAARVSSSVSPRR